MSEIAGDGQEIAEQLDEDMMDTGIPVEDDVPIQGEVGDLSELLIAGEDVIDTSPTQSAEEAALHVVDAPDQRMPD